MKALNLSIPTGEIGAEKKQKVGEDDTHTSVPVHLPLPAKKVGARSD